MEWFLQDFRIISQIKSIHIRKEDGPLLKSIIIPLTETLNLSTDSILWRQWWIELCPIRSMANLRKGTQSPIICRYNKRLHFISAFTVQFHVIVDILSCCWNPRAIERGLHWIFYKTEMKIWAVGCGLGWTVLKKGLGRLWATFLACFFTFSGSKKIFKIFLKTP